MPVSSINGVRLYWEQQGAGPPLVLVHGSWGDHHNWDGVVSGLAGTFRVITYDRRGHSQSERLDSQGHIEEDVADLAALIETNQLAPAHVAGNSFGAAITLKLATVRPDLLASLVVHEPPLIGMLHDDPESAAVGQRIARVLDTLKSGQTELGAREFVENVALGPGMWEQLPPEVRKTFVFNAPTWVDEMNEDSSVMTVDLQRLSAFTRPALLTRGDQSPRFFGIVLDRVTAAMPHAQRHTFRGAGHVPHLTHPGEFVEVVRAFAGAPAAEGGAR